MSDAYISGLFALAGGALGYLGALLIASRTSKIEERKHFRELALNLAFHLDQRESEMAQKLSDINKQILVTPPISVWVVHSLKMMEIASDSSLTADEIGRRLAHLNKFTDSVITEIRNPKHYE